MIGTPYDLIADRFHSMRSALHGKEAAYLAHLLDTLPPGSLVLDLGCGTGHPIASHIASRGHRVVGVDGSAAMLAFAQNQLPDHCWIHAMIEQVEFEHSFAAVVCWDSLFHLPRQQHESVIRKIHRWLAPGGRLMLSSGGLVADAGCGFTDTMFGHEFYYDSLPPDQLTTLLADIGFEILSSEMCSAPDGDRDKGKWATLAQKRA